MLFNTLAYAKFFAVVFLLSWLLVRRSFAVWVPWVALAAAVLFSSPLFNAETSCVAAATWSSCSQPLTQLGITAIAFVLTGWLWRQQPPESAPPWRITLASSALNLGAFAWIASRSSTSWVQLVFGAASQNAWWRSAWLESTAGSAALLVIAVAGLAAVLRARRIRLLFILCASYVFYAHWDVRFLPLIFGSSTIDYWLGKRIGHATSEIARKRWLWVTVVLNLGVLAIFKYLNFGIDTARSAIAALGYHPPEWSLAIALPVGISFFTFESMSYVIDVYRRELPPHDSYLEYLSFVAYFPHLVAGPIVRPRDLLPQLGGPPRWNTAEASEGVYLIGWGLLKKVAIGDYLALNLIDRVFDAPTQYSALECYTAVVAYAVQIYCDFSGYTDVAIGSALLLGVRFPLNFDAPYKADSIQQFWRRWHISLSTWLRDYLYIPLGGNRKGTGRTYFNLMLTMLLGGLWHGASWTFVVWGGLHGGALAINRYVASRGGRRRAPGTGWRRHAGHAGRVFFTFHFVCLTWVFFRAPTFDQARVVFSQLATLTTFTPNLHWKVMAVLTLGLLTHYAPERWYQACKRGFVTAPAPAQGLVLCCVALLLREMISAEAVPFVYFQF